MVCHMQIVTRMYNIARLLADYKEQNHYCPPSLPELYFMLVIAKHIIS